MFRESNKLYLLSILVCCLLSCSMADDPQFEAGSVIIKVTSPASLKKAFEDKGAINYTLANFGYVPWGRKLVGRVYLADQSDACQPIAPLPVGSGRAAESESPIVIADRGGCTFVMKAQNAQLAGAKFLIVLDNVDEFVQNILPIDDGHGGSISIPTVIIDKKSGDLLKKAAQEEGTQIIISATFHMPKQRTDSIDYEVWITSSDTTSFDIIKDLDKYQKLLGKKAKMTPHYAIWYCPACEASGFTAYDNEDCFCGGKYCHPDPDGNGPLTGRDTLLEDLRQLCIFDASPEKWWDYHRKFTKSCLNSQELEKCSYETINRTSIELSRIEQCVNSSFNGVRTNACTNYKLKSERETYLQRGIVAWPAIVINNLTYRGNLQPAKLIFQAMCDGFDVTPDECSDAAKRDIPEGPAGDKIKQQLEDRETKRSSNLWLILGVIALAIIIFVAIFLWYKRQMRKEILTEMNYQISSTMHRYMAMKDEGDTSRNSQQNV